MKRECSWCGEAMPTLTAERPDETSHGMCGPCLQRQLAEIPRRPIEISVARGYVGDQFARDCYTLSVHNSLKNHSMNWEFDKTGRRPPRFMAYLIDGEVTGLIRETLEAVTRRRATKGETP